MILGGVFEAVVQVPWRRTSQVKMLPRYMTPNLRPDARDTSRVIDMSENPVMLSAISRELNLFSACISPVHAVKRSARHGGTEVGRTGLDRIHPDKLALGGRFTAVRRSRPVRCRDHDTGAIVVLRITVKCVRQVFHHRNARPDTTLACRLLARVHRQIQWPRARPMHSADDYHIGFRVVVLGDSGVGKSTLLKSAHGGHRPLRCAR